MDPPRDHQHLRDQRDVIDLRVLRDDLRNIRDHLIGQPPEGRPPQPPQPPHPPEPPQPPNLPIVQVIPPAQPPNVPIIQVLPPPQNVANNAVWPWLLPGFPQIGPADLPPPPRIDIFQLAGLNNPPDQPWRGLFPGLNEIGIFGPQRDMAGQVMVNPIEQEVQAVAPANRQREAAGYVIREDRQPQPEVYRRRDPPRAPHIRPRNEEVRPRNQEVRPRNERLHRNLARLGPQIPGYAQLIFPIRRPRELEVDFRYRLHYLRTQILPRLPHHHLDRKFVYLALPGCLEPIGEERAAMIQRYGQERPDYALLAFLALENLLPRDVMEENFRQPRETRFISEDLRVAHIERRNEGHARQMIGEIPNAQLIEAAAAPRLPGQTGKEYFIVFFGRALGSRVTAAPGDLGGPPPPPPQDLNVQGFDAAWFRQQIEKMREIGEKLARRLEEEFDKIYREQARKEWLQLDHQIACRNPEEQLRALWEAAKLRGMKRMQWEAENFIDMEFEELLEDYLDEEVDGNLLPLNPLGLLPNPFAPQPPQ